MPSSSTRNAMKKPARASLGMTYMKNGAVSEEEYKHVRVCEGSEQKFMCKLCDGKIFSKPSASYHYANKHGLPASDVSKWVVVLDGHKVKQKRTDNLQLTAAILQYEENNQCAGCAGPPSDEEEEKDTDEEGEATVADAGEEEDAAPSPDVEDDNEEGDGLAYEEEAAPPKFAYVAPRPKRAPLCVGGAAGRSDDHLRVLQEQIASLTQLVKPKELTIAVQTLRIKDAVRDWDLSEEDAQKARKAYPFVAQQVDVEPWVGYLANMQQDVETRSIYVKALSRFVAMLQTDDGEDVALDGLLVNAYVSDIFTDLVGLPIFNEARSWARQITSALEHYVAYQLIGFQKSNDAKAVGFLTQLRDSVLKPLHKKSAGAKTFSANAKKVKDSYKIEKMAPPDEIKKAVHAAMVDLASLSAHFAEQESIVMPARAKQVANAIMVGIIFNNQFAGRSQEWEVMTAGHVQQQFESGENHFECSKYKTSKKYGILGKWISPGTKVAFSKYMGLPDKYTDLLLDPALVKSKRVAVASALLQFHRMYLPGFPPMTVTLLRKNLHTKMNNPEEVEKCMALLCAVDRHRVATGKKHYVVSNPKDDAATSKLIFEAFMGAPVEWPTDEEIQAAQRPYEAIVAVDRHMGRGDAEAEDGMDGDEAEAEDGTDDADPAGETEVEEGGGEDDEHASDDEERVEEEVGLKHEQAVLAGGEAEEAEEGVESDGLKRRRIEYNPSAGKFEKHEVAEPNLLHHPVPPAQKQTVLAIAPAEGAEPMEAEEPTKRKRVYLSEEQKRWIIEKHSSFMGPCNDVAPAVFFSNLLDEGIKEKVLTEGHKADSLRTFVRDRWKRQENA
jgi:hypothetical protein